MRTSIDHAADGEPDCAALAAFVEHRLTGPERDAAIVHLASCARCRAIVAELARGRTAGREPSVWPRLLPIAATLAIAVAGGSLYWMATRSSGVPSPAAVVPSPPPPAAAPPSAPAVVPALPANPAPPAPPPMPPDRRRSAGTRTVGAKTFRLVAGEWIDDDYRVTDPLPAVDITDRAALDRHPSLQPYAGLGRRFTVVVDNTVYRVALP